jgi:hypothetical protein
MPSASFTTRWKSSGRVARSDLGNVAPNRLESCKADYAILSYYDLYRTEGTLFPRELSNYEKLLAGGRTVALFEPRPGRAGGPSVIVVALRKY